MTDEEKFKYLRDIESILIPTIHRLGIFYLGDVLMKIRELELTNSSIDADSNPTGLGYQRALNDIIHFVDELIEGLIGE